ncbi:MAG: LytR/AlgR family response regulator transcription factor [Enterocloster sp.]
MIHICICDDSDAMRDELCGLIQELCQKHSIAASVSCCSSGEELLFDPDDKNRTTDIFFLDILMKKLNGIETAARLRAINPTAQIIFLTVSKEHVFEALDVMPLHYLLKQDMRTEKIEKVFLKAVSLAEKGRKENLHINLERPLALSSRRTLFFSR